MQHNSQQQEPLQWEINRFGVVKFNKQFFQSKRNESLSQEQVKMLNNAMKWNLSNINLENSSWIQLFGMIEENHTRSIILDDQQKSDKILDLIVVPTYHKLIFLSLENCSIFNIQSMAFLKTPLISNLYLSRNNITSCKPLYKLNFENLNSVIIDKNQIISIDSSRTLILKEEDSDSDQQGFQYHGMSGFFIFNDDVGIWAKTRKKHKRTGMGYTHSDFWEGKARDMIISTKRYQAIQRKFNWF